MSEIALALDQPEAPRIFVHEAIDPQLARIGQRTPDPFPVTGLRHETVAVVNLRTEIVKAPSGAVLAVEKHGGERRHAQLPYTVARVKVAMHFNLSDGTGSNLELIRASHALAVEERINREHALGWLRPHQPEIGVGGEFLSAGRSGIDRQPACRSAVMLIAAEHTEIGSAEEDDQLVFDGG